MRYSEERNYRISVYVDCILGLISSTLALTGIVFITIKYGISNLKMYTIGLTFWICYFIFSLFLIGLGIYTHMKNKNFDETKARKDLRPP
ncbi:MAG: hypothetical protein KAT66_02940, partial [Candidatus Lokiarchaeota archaeon]|nr:hypothetical protein [Candidatus Lokiarchaeota archaeon]